MVLPDAVHVGGGEQQPERRQRQQQGEEDDGGPAGRRANLHRVAILFLLAAFGADLGGAHEPAFYLLLGAVVVTAHSALDAYGRLVELPGSAPTLAAARLQTALAATALVLVLVAAAVRAPVLGEAVPAVGLSAVVASLALLATAGLVKLATR